MQRIYDMTITFCDGTEECCFETSYAQDAVMLEWILTDGRYRIAPWTSIKHVSFRLDSEAEAG